MSVCVCACVCVCVCMRACVREHYSIQSKTTAKKELFCACETWIFYIINTSDNKHQITTQTNKEPLNFLRFTLDPEAPKGRLTLIIISLKERYLLVRPREPRSLNVYAPTPYSVQTWLS